MIDDLNPIGILRTRAKDPSLTSGAVATLTAAVKYLEDYDRNLTARRLSVSKLSDATEEPLVPTIIRDEAFHRPKRSRRNIPGRRGLSSSTVQ